MYYAVFWSAPPIGVRIQRGHQPLLFFVTVVLEGSSSQFPSVSVQGKGGPASTRQRSQAMVLQTSRKVLIQDRYISLAILLAFSLKHDSHPCRKVQNRPASNTFVFPGNGISAFFFRNVSNLITQGSSESQRSWKEVDTLPSCMKIILATTHFTD